MTFNASACQPESDPLKGHITEQVLLKTCRLTSGGTTVGSFIGFS